MDVPEVNFESGWKIIKEEAIDKIEKYLEADYMEHRGSLFSASEYTRLYTIVYNMCAKKNPYCYSKELYKQYGECLSLYTSHKIKPMLTDTKDVHRAKMMIEAWKKYSFYTNWMNKFLKYLDRYYVEYNSVMHLSAYTKNIFRVSLFNELREEMRQTVYKFYDHMREDPSDDEKKVFCDLVDLYTELDKENKEKMYEVDIERKVLENVEQYYKNNVDKWIKEFSYDQYIIFIENCIEEEYIKNKSLNLNEKTCEKVTLQIVKILIYNNLDFLLSNKESIFELLKQNNVRCLRRMYILFSYFPSAIKGLKQLIGEYVKQQGNELKNKYIAIAKNIQKRRELESEDTENNVEEEREIKEKKGISSEYALCGYIEQLIHLHNHYDQMFKLSFFDISNKTMDPNFKECLKEYFETFVEHEDEHFSTARLLVMYADNSLKQSSYRYSIEDSVKHEEKLLHGKEMLEENELYMIGFKKDVTSSENKPEEEESTKANSQLCAKITNIVEIFNYTSNKELFFDFYRIYLANRLIDTLYISLDMEKKFIEKLYFLYGSQHTSKLGGMIQDIITNNQTNKKFLEYVEHKMLMQGVTSDDDSSKLTLQKNVRRIVDSFSVKILNRGYWPTMEKSTLKLNKTFSSCIEMFEEYYKHQNKNKKLDWVFEVSEVIVESTINGKNYRFHCNLIGAHILLLLNQHKHITFELVEKELQIDLKTFINNIHSCIYEYKVLCCSDDVVDWSNSSFYLNSNFSHSSDDVYIRRAALLLSKEHEKIKEDRSMAIEAAIVRVMKKHKSLFYDQIFQYVKRALANFTAPNKIIEQKIDLLVEREYIAKEENSQLYTYIS